MHNADGVLVVDRGRIVERGTHLELIAAVDVYAAMYLQFLNGSVFDLAKLILHPMRKGREASETVC